ncbi:MAG TPA: hypothetical protein VGO47_12650 [Chlamydiales bacterium]|nr:hypothetical protein [Chlamydiales bacterium]
METLRFSLFVIEEILKARLTRLMRETLSSFEDQARWEEAIRVILSGIRVRNWDSSSSLTFNYEYIRRITLSRITLVCKLEFPVNNPLMLAKVVTVSAESFTYRCSTFLHRH